MRRSVAFALTAGAVAGAMLSPAAAVAGAHRSAAASAPPRPAAAAPVPRSGSDPGTIVTFAVTSGALTLTAPSSANLGSGTPGNSITGLLGAVIVEDQRALLSASWTATAASTSYTTGSGSGNETIPASAVTYDPGTVSKTGVITINAFDITMSGSPQTIVAGTAGVGNNSATWDPSITVEVPAGAVGGTYTGTITDSVS